MKQDFKKVLPLVLLIATLVCTSFMYKPKYDKESSIKLTCVTSLKIIDLLTQFNYSMKIENAFVKKMFSLPAINGQNCFYYSASTTYGSGSISADPNTLIAVTGGASGPPPGTYSVYMTISGATFSDGTNNIYAVNGNVTKYFVYPSNHGVSWSGNFSEPNSYGSGSICVQ